MKTDDALLAEFMGNKPIWNGDKDLIIGYHIVYGQSVGQTLLQFLEYKTSWDWLMPVIKRINEVNVSTDAMFDSIELSGMMDALERAVMRVDIKQAFQIVVSIVKWYKNAED
jgi:hypothetical protein